MVNGIIYSMAGLGTVIATLDRPAGCKHLHTEPYERIPCGTWFSRLCSCPRYMRSAASHRRPKVDVRAFNGYYGGGTLVATAVTKEFKR